MGANMVKIKKGNKTVEVVESAYEKVWKDKDWGKVEETSESEAKSEPAAPEPKKLNDPAKAQNRGE